MGETKEIERSVQMRLYVLDKRQFVIVFIIFFICLFLIALIGIAGPSTIQSIDYKIDNLGKSIIGPYEIHTEYLDKFYQRFWLTMKAKTDINDEFRQSINVSIFIKNPTFNSQIYNRQQIIHCDKKVC